MGNYDIYSLREFLWELPEKIKKAYKKTSPFFDIIIYVIVAVTVYRSVSAPYLFKFVQGKESEIYSEGLVGEIGTLNPLFVTGSDTDRALFSLIYTDLFTINDEGEPEPALAKEWQVTDGGKKIRFVLSDQYYWHDGEQVTAEDVLFTFERSIAMSESGLDTFGGTLTGLNIIADSEFSLLFEFDETIQNIFEVLSVYIIPEHIHKTLDVRGSYRYGRDGNVVGSGMYKVVDLDDDSIELDDFEKDSFSPLVKKIHIDFFQNLDQLKIALKNGYIDAIAGVDPELVSDILEEYQEFSLYKIHVDQRKKVMYFNLRNELFADSNIRAALSHSINKKALVDEFYFAGKECKSTWSSGSWALDPELEDYFPYDEKLAKELFADAGYEVPENGEYLVNGVGDRFEIDLAYVMNIQNDALAHVLQEQFEEVGVYVNLIDVSYVSLVNELLATRKFDILLMEIEVNDDPDQYNLWHSTKVNYPDLNIAGYENNRVDIMLERARSETNRQTRKEDYFQIQKFISQDVPVVVLYEPAYTFVVDSKFTNLTLDKVSFPYQRYQNIENWIIE